MERANDYHSVTLRLLFTFSCALVVFVATVQFGYYDYGLLISVTSVVPFLLLMFLVWIFNKYICFIPFVGNILGIPDFRGRWEGIYYDETEYEWCHTWQSIKQRGNKITSIRAWGAGTKSDPSRRNESIAVTASIVATPDYPELHWSYTSNRKDGKEVVGGTHFGLHRFTLHTKDNIKFLVGTYVNNRRRIDFDDNGYPIHGTRGFLVLVHVGGKGSENYDSNKMAIKIPPTDPTYDTNIWQIIDQYVADKARTKATV